MYNFPQSSQGSHHVKFLGFYTVSSPDALVGTVYCEVIDCYHSQIGWTTTNLTKIPNAFANECVGDGCNSYAIDPQEGPFHYSFNGPECAQSELN